MPKSISARIAVLFLLTVLVPLLVLGTFFSKERYNSIQTQLLSRQQHEAAQLAQDVTAYLEDLVNELELISNILSLQGGSDAQKFILLKSLQVYQPVFQKLAFMDSKGRELSIRNSDSAIFMDHSDENGTHLEQVKALQRPLSSIIRNPDGSSPTLSIVCPIFFLNDSFVNGAVSTKASLDGLCAAVLHFSQVSQIPAGLFFSDGTKLSSNFLSLPSAIALPETFAELKQAKGFIADDRLIGVSPVQFEGVELYVVVSSELKTLMAPFFQSLKIFIFILVLIFAASLLTGLFFVKHLLTSPLSVLSGAARKIRDGDLSKRVALTGENEFSELADTFNQMTRTLEKSQATLQQESRQRRKAENESRQAMIVAQQANEAKSLFLATMSHEIRTPINGIMGMTSLMLNSDLNEAQQYRMGLVNRSTRRLLNIITAILDFSKIEAGEVSLEPVRFDPRLLVQDALEIIQLEVNEAELRLFATVAEDVPPELVADSGKIYQVLLNLLVNAVKHTNTGEIAVTVVLASENDKTKTVQFCVSDTGAGVPESARETIFAPFSQVETKSAVGQEGTGLGLAICDKFVSLLGGKIWFKNNEDLGSSFYFTCKCEGVDEDCSLDSDLSNKDSETDGHESLAGITIYIAEDEFINQQMLSSYLRKLGGRVLLYDNGQELLAAMEQGQPDIILMDIRMPVIDGLEATKRIREVEKKSGGRHVPIIALTAQATIDFKKKCFSSGMDKYLTKPIELERLVGIILDFQQAHSSQ